MTTELCRDVERLILQKAEASALMTLTIMGSIVMDEDPPQDEEVLMAFTRSMMEPEWHVHVMLGRQSSFLCRKKETLAEMFQSYFYTNCTEYDYYTVIYQQGEERVTIFESTGAPSVEILLRQIENLVAIA